MKPVEVDLAEVNRAFDAAELLVVPLPYLSERRGIPAEIYLYPRLAKRIRVDARGTVLFP